MALFAPLAAVVEVRTQAGDGRDARETENEGAPRVFRLSRSVAESAVLLERPAPFDIGQPVWITFVVPDISTTTRLTLRAVIALGDAAGEGAEGGSELVFVEPTREARQTIVRYVAGRLGLPGAEPGR